MDSEYEKIIGTKIRYYRESLNITQEQLSARMQTQGCDVTRSALAKIEVGQRHIYADELHIIKELLGISYENLLE